MDLNESEAIAARNRAAMRKQIVEKDENNSGITESCQKETEKKGGKKKVKKNL